MQQTSRSLLFHLRTGSWVAGVFTVRSPVGFVRSEADGGQFQWRDERCVRRGIREGQRWKGGKNQFSPSLDMINQLALISWLSARSLSLCDIALAWPKHHKYISVLLGALSKRKLYYCVLCVLSFLFGIAFARRLLGRSNKFCLAWDFKRTPRNWIFCFYGLEICLIYNALAWFALEADTFWYMSTSLMCRGLILHWICRIFH